jgi:predicted aldo/keto reductase-like oxidoreductase
MTEMESHGPSEGETEVDMKGQGTNVTRRGFLTTAMAGVFSMGVLGTARAADQAAETEKSGGRKGGAIMHRVLGRTKLRLPIVGMGVMNANNPELIQASYELGIRHFDTAAYYQYGRNEQMVGSVINRMGVRDDVVIATKVFTPLERRGCDEVRSKEKLIGALEGSLERLKTDYVDILYVHNVSDPAEVSDGAVMDAMESLKRQGKVRFAGVSTHERMAEVVEAVADSGFYDVVLTSINFTMADDTALLAAIEHAASKGVGVVAMKTQAGGHRFPDEEIRKKYANATIATAALKWALRNEHITTAIPGYTVYEHMEQDFSVARGLEYTAEEKAFLADNEIAVGMGFCRQCRVCMRTCPRGVDIPALMRTHMYAAQYANFHHARATLDEVPRGRGLDACTACRACTARCVRAVDIARNIEELKLIYA